MKIPSYGYYDYFRRCTQNPVTKSNITISFLLRNLLEHDMLEMWILEVRLVIYFTDCELVQLFLWIAFLFLFGFKYSLFWSWYWSINVFLLKSLRGWEDKFRFFSLRLARLNYLIIQFIIKVMFHAFMVTWVQIVIMGCLKMIPINLPIYNVILGAHIFAYQSSLFSHHSRPPLAGDRSRSTLSSNNTAADNLSHLENTALSCLSKMEFAASLMYRRYLFQYLLIT